MAIIDLPDHDEAELYKALHHYQKYKDSKDVKFSEMKYKGERLHTANNWVIGLIALTFWILGIWKLFELIF